jgi:hypothetical protein
LCACSSVGDIGFLPLADPGKYQYATCQQLTVVRTAALARQKGLQDLINKAEEGAGGVFVGAMIYRPDSIVADQDLRLIDATAREKNCPPPPAPATWRSNTAIQ